MDGWYMVVQCVRVLLSPVQPGYPIGVKMVLKSNTVSSNCHEPYNV